MAKTFTAVANTDNFETWLNRTNDMIGEFANVVTVEGSAATGNAVITGSIQVGMSMLLICMVVLLDQLEPLI